MKMSESQKAFEEWCKGRHAIRKDSDTGEYIEPRTHFANEAWQASRADLIDKLQSEEMVNAALDSIPQWQWIVDHKAAAKEAIKTIVEGL